MSLPLDLFIEVADPSGTRYRWDANQAPGSRLRNFSFRTKLGEGFSDASGSLARRIDFDYPDLQLLNDVVVVGADGSVAYEGRVAAMPRELTDAHSIGVTLAGWMAHAKDRKCQEIYVDRDLGAWGPPSRGRKISLMTSNFTPTDPSQAVDPTDSTPGVTTGFSGAWVSPFKPISEAWYDAGPGLLIGRVVYQWKRESANVTAGPDSFQWLLFAGSDDKTDVESSGDLQAAGPSALSAFIFPTVRRYAGLQFAYLITSAGADGTPYGVAWYKLAVYGNHGVTTYTGQSGEPEGVRASDVIKHIAGKYCPRLNTAGVMDTTYVIQHLAFKDRTFPYDAFLEINKYHLWHLGVWEDKTLTFRPYDLTDYNWQIRTDDPGTTFTPQGPSTDDLFNGIVVTYTDLLTGLKNVLSPKDFTDLRDTATENPWNQAGLTHWNEIELSTPTLQAQALQIGRMALADGNRPKAPGTITVRGYVQDRAGNEQPVWKVRAGETISVTNFPNDSPRLIHETSYDDESKTNTLSIEAPASSIDALFDRLATAVTATGVSA